MTTPIQYRHDRLVVPLDGAITPASAQAFVVAVDERLEMYFYRRLEVVVSSPGGSTAALEHMVRALARWRGAGVHVRTRVVVEAASAAAVLASLGDERIAEPGARLLYHFSRLVGADAITADASAELHGELARTDERIIGRLVERALATPARVPHRAEPCDRNALERIVAALNGRARPRRRAQLKRLAAQLGPLLDAAVRERDRATLARAYRALARIDRPISAALARTLRLIDRVDDVPDDAHKRCPDTPTGLVIPQWRALYPPAGAVPRAVLTRHVATFGETGSGKTASVILPVLGALARTPRGHLGGALVIDPKRDLAPVLAHAAPGRLHHVRADTVALNLMAPARWAIDADLGAGRWTSAATRMLLRVASFVPSSPLRVLAPHRVTSPNAEFFAQEGTALLRDVLGFILMLTAPDAPPAHQWVDPNDARALRWVSALGERARGDDGARGPNALALCAWALTGALAPPVPEPTRSDAPPPPPWLFGALAAQAMAVWATAPGEGRDLLRRVCEYWSAQACVARQHAGVLATARSACAELASPRIARTLYFGCEPGWREAAPHAVDFARLASRAADGRFVLYQPRRDGLDALVGTALKATFFEAVLAEPDRVSAGERMPLVGYVADEFHRFVTSDAVHGEQSFLDTCRSLGAFCVLATQSTRSIAHALSLGGAPSDTNEAALDILMNNAATKLFFRSTDPDTAARVQALCPRRPGFGAATALRPLATLAPGEAWVSLPDGRFERRQLAPVTPDAPRARTSAPERAR